jgi:regulator of replication initiation timing
MPKKPSPQQAKINRLERKVRELEAEVTGLKARAKKLLQDSEKYRDEALELRGFKAGVIATQHTSRPDLPPLRGALAVQKSTAPADEPPRGPLFRHEPPKDF